MKINAHVPSLWAKGCMLWHIIIIIIIIVCNIMTGILYN